MSASAITMVKFFFLQPLCRVIHFNSAHCLSNDVVVVFFAGVFRHCCWSYLHKPREIKGNRCTVCFKIMQKVKLIIDTDPGYDDAMAIGAAMRWPNAELLALTSVHGNVPLRQTTMNALTVRQIFERKDVPVYKGAESPIFANVRHDAKYHHGVDGLWGVTENIAVEEGEVEKKHAVNAIIDIVMANKGEVTLVAIGPLTNLALAVKMNPELPKLLKELVILGGNYTGLGNVTETAEFNFFTDPLAAQIVLEEYKCPVFIVPWETALENKLSSDFVKSYCGMDTTRSKFFKKILDASHSVHATCYGADRLAMCVALNKESVIVEGMDTFATVESFGNKTSGMMVVEKRENARLKMKKEDCNVCIIKKVNAEKVNEILIHSVS